MKGVPLRFAVYAQNDSSPVIELKATDVSYGPQPASVFKVAPPAGAKVVRVDTSKARSSALTRASADAASLGTATSRASGPSRSGCRSGSSRPSSSSGCPVAT